MPKPIGDRFSSQARDRRYETLLRSVSDGRVWLLEKGRDYRCGEPNLRGHVRTYALQAKRLSDRLCVGPGRLGVDG